MIDANALLSQICSSGSPPSEHLVPSSNSASSQETGPADYNSFVTDETLACQETSQPQSSPLASTEAHLAARRAQPNSRRPDQFEKVELNGSNPTPVIYVVYNRCTGASASVRFKVGGTVNFESRFRTLRTGIIDLIPKFKFELTKESELFALEARCHEALESKMDEKHKQKLFTRLRFLTLPFDDFSNDSCSEWFQGSLDEARCVIVSTIGAASLRKSFEVKESAERWSWEEIVQTK